jgi:hypothetical protein
MAATVIKITLSLAVVDESLAMFSVFLINYTNKKHRRPRG